MNDSTSDPETNPSDSEPKEDSTSERPFANFSESLRDAARAGADDAKRTFDRVFPKAKDDFARGAQEVAYGVSYAAAFGAALLSDILPENLRDGFRDGASAGRRAADEVVRQREERERTDPSGDEPVTA